MFGALIAAGIDCGIHDFPRAASSPGRQAAEIGPDRATRESGSLAAAEIWVTGEGAIYRRCNASHQGLIPVFRRRRSPASAT
jgi:hypothetical protein